MRRQNLRIYNVWRKKNNVFFRLFISHFFDKPLFYPAAPFPPPPPFPLLSPHKYLLLTFPPKQTKLPSPPLKNE